MRKNAKGTLDRRDFVIASLATVGASATFAATAGADKAQDTAASPQPMATVYTGDLIQGKKVISALDVNDLDPGKKHTFYFQGVQMPTGQHWRGRDGRQRSVAGQARCPRERCTRR